MKPFTLGRTFKNNKYYEFDKYGVTVMKPWPEMLAYRKTRCRPWKPIRPTLDFHHSFMPDNENISHCYQCEMNAVFEKNYEHVCAPHPLVTFLSHVPEEILSLIRPVANRHWHLLALFSRCGQPAIELFKSTPALAWMLASSWAFKEKPVTNHFRSIRTLFSSGKTQRQVLAWLDYPSSKSTLKLLRKVDMKYIDVSFFLSLKGIISEKSKVHLISHLPTIDYATIRLVNEFKMNFSYHFLLRYQMEERTKQFQIKRSLSTLFPEQIVSGEMKLSEEYLDQLLNQDETVADKKIPIVSRNRVFPWPPYMLPSGFPEVEYIDSEDALIQAGQVMHNCLHGYVEACLFQSIQVYRLNNNERCVFAIGGTPVKGLWQLFEIKAACNQDASAESILFVKAWIDALNACNKETKVGLFLPD